MNGRINGQRYRQVASFMYIYVVGQIHTYVHQYMHTRVDRQTNTCLRTYISNSKYKQTERWIKRQTESYIVK